MMYVIEVEFLQMNMFRDEQLRMYIVLKLIVFSPVELFKNKNVIMRNFWRNFFQYFPY